MECLLQISFLDYLAYIPLFLSMHDKMITNPFDMSNTKYQPDRKPTAVYSRDLNPLGHPLSKASYEIILVLDKVFLRVIGVQLRVYHSFRRILGGWTSRRQNTSWGPRRVRRRPSEQRTTARRKTCCADGTTIYDGRASKFSTNIKSKQCSTSVIGA